MIGFDLQKAIDGAKLITRSGREARIICYDRLDKSGLRGNIIALIKGKEKKYETVVYYDINGRQINHIKDFDLFIND